MKRALSRPSEEGSVPPRRVVTDRSRVASSVEGARSHSYQQCARGTHFAGDPLPQVGLSMTPYLLCSVRGGHPMDTGVLHLAAFYHTRTSYPPTWETCLASCKDNPGEVLFA